MYCTCMCPCVCVLQLPEETTNLYSIVPSKRRSYWSGKHTHIQTVQINSIGQSLISSWAMGRDGESMLILDLWRILGCDSRFHSQLPLDMTCTTTFKFHLYGIKFKYSLEGYNRIMLIMGKMVPPEQKQIHQVTGDVVVYVGMFWFIRMYLCV